MTKKRRSTSTRTKIVPVIQRMRLKRPSILPPYVATFSGRCNQIGRADASDGTPATPRALQATRKNRPRGATLDSKPALTLEVEVDRLGLRSADRHVLGLRAVLLVPGLDHVVTRRKVLDLEGSLVVGDGEERVVENPRVSPHPLVDVALEADGHLDGIELLEGLHPLERLADVELRVLLREGVNIVQCRVTIEDPQRLTGLDPEDVWVILAALLIDRDRGRRRRVRSCDPFLDIDEDPLKGVVRVHHDFLRVDGRRVRRLAESVRLHLDLFHGRRGALERDFAGQRRAARGGGSSCGRRPRDGSRGSRSGSRLLLEQLILVLATAAGDKRDGNDERQEQNERALDHRYAYECVNQLGRGSVLVATSDRVQRRGVRINPDPERL